MAGPVLITGALGQDGRLLAERLAAAGRRVIGLVRPEQADCEAAPCPLVTTDLGDPAAVEALVADLAPAHIFHLAAVHHASDVPLTASGALWRAMTETNTLATTFFIQAILARAPACRLVYAASSQMYRPGAADRDIDEKTERDPSTWYGLTKAWSMDAIRFARERYGLHGSTAILFNHESKYRPEAFISRKITTTAARIRLGLAESLHVRNIGARADWCAAEDVVSALERMAEATVPDDYVVGSGRLSSVREMVTAAFAAAGLPAATPVDSDEDAPRPALRADGAKIRTALGWEPGLDLAGMIRRMVEADLARLSASAPSREGTP